MGRKCYAQHQCLRLNKQVEYSLRLRERQKESRKRKGSKDIQNWGHAPLLWRAAVLVKCASWNWVLLFPKERPEACMIRISGTVFENLAKHPHLLFNPPSGCRGHQDPSVVHYFHYYLLFSYFLLFLFNKRKSLLYLLPKENIPSLSFNCLLLPLSTVYWLYSFL